MRRVRASWTRSSGGGKDLFFRDHRVFLSGLKLNKDQRQKDLGVGMIRTLVREERLPRELDSLFLRDVVECCGRNWKLAVDLLENMKRSAQKLPVDLEVYESVFRICEREADAYTAGRLIWRIGDSNEAQEYCSALVKRRCGVKDWGGAAFVINSTLKSEYKLRSSLIRDFIDSFYGTGESHVFKNVEEIKCEIVFNYCQYIH